MTREEADVIVMQTLEWVLRMYERYRTDDKFIAETKEAFDMAIAALRGPQPDPDTGLVRCGCGGKAEIRKWEWANDTYIAGCTVCDANVDFPYDIDETDKIISDWNRAMGRRTEK